MLEEILEALKADEVSQKELAAAAKISEGALSLIVTGITQSPKYSTVEALHLGLRRIRAARLASGEPAPEQGVA